MPTPKQIADMAARGWEYDDGDFFVRGVDGEHRVLMMRIRWWRGKAWMADYGTSGVSFAPLRDEHETPEGAADEAEAWLRRVLSGIRFPWLMAVPRGS